MMSNRFAAGLVKVREVGGKAGPATPDVTTDSQQTTTIAPSRIGKVAVSAYFDPAVRQQLAILAIKENRSQAALMADALNLLFEKYGEPTIARA